MKKKKALFYSKYSKNNQYFLLISSALAKKNNVCFLSDSIDGKISKKTNIQFIEKIELYNKYRFVSIIANKKFNLLFRYLCFLKKKIIVIFLSSFQRKKISRIRKWIILERYICRQFLEDFSFDYIVVPDDRTATFLPLIFSCNEIKKPVYIITNAWPAGKRDLIFSKLKRNLYTHNYIKKYIDKYKNHFEKIDDERYTSFYTLDWLKALSREKILVNNPWVMGGSGLCRVIAFGKKMRDELINDGCNEALILIGGHAEYDELFYSFKDKSNLRKRINKKYSFDNNILLIIALPQIGEHGTVSWECHWDEIEFILSTIQKFNVHVLISLHPKMDIENYKKIASNYNMAIAEEKLRFILPASDIFIAYGSSTTLQWSVLCHIPCINISYHNNSIFYNDVKSIKSIYNKNDVSKIIQNYLYDDNIRNGIINESKDDANVFGTFDGNSTERISNILLN